MFVHFISSTLPLFYGALTCFYLLGVLNKLSTVRAPSEAFLFSIDISSLYTNMDTELGSQAVRQAFSRYPDATRLDEALLQLLELSLTRNDS